MDNCVFCNIISGKEKAYKIWEDEHHIAFLSIFPNTPGFTVVATKKHLSSYCFELNNNVLSNLIIASKKVGLLLDKKLEGVGRTGLIMEGFGVNHAHTKLIPLHGTQTDSEWKPIETKKDHFFNTYEGYISSHDCEQASQKELAEMQERILK